jgi:hypothetical protein
MPVSTLTWVAGAPSVTLPGSTNLANRATYDSYITASMSEPDSFWEIASKDTSTADHNYLLLRRKDGSPGRILFYLKISGATMSTSQSIYIVPGDSSINLATPGAPCMIYAPHSTSNTPSFSSTTINIGGDETNAVWSASTTGDITNGVINMLQSQDSIFLMKGPVVTAGGVKWHGVGHILDDGENVYAAGIQSPNDIVAPLIPFGSPNTNIVSNIVCVRRDGVLERLGSVFATIQTLTVGTSFWYNNNNSQYPMFLPLPPLISCVPRGDSSNKAFRLRQIAFGRSQAADMEKLVGSNGNTVAICCPGMSTPRTHLSPAWATNFII